MKVLVTGATGFVGSHVVRELLRRGHTVVAASRHLMTGPRFDWFSAVEKREMDISAIPDNIYDHLGKPDLLIHLAWSGLPNYKALFHIEKNLFESYFFLKVMIEGGLQRLSVLGTCFEYGLQEGCLTPGTPTAPCTAYGLAKDTLRKFIEILAQQYPIDWKWIRLFYLHGEGQAKSSLLQQLQAAIDRGDSVFPMSGGEQLRDYLPVEKAAERIVSISTGSQRRGIFNCCSGRPIAIRALVENYLKKTGQSIELDLGRYPYPDYEPMAFWGTDED